MVMVVTSDFARRYELRRRDLGFRIYDWGYLCCQIQKELRVGGQSGGCSEGEHVAGLGGGR